MVSKHEKVMAEYTPETFKVLLKKLVQRPDDFEAQDCAACFQHLCVLGGKGASDAQVRPAVCQRRVATVLGLKADLYRLERF